MHVDLIFWPRFLGACLGACVAFTLYWKSALSAKYMRRNGINGEIALLYKIKKRTTLLMGAWLTFVAWSSVNPTNRVDHNVLFIGVLVSLWTLFGIIKDRSHLELLAAARLARSQK